VQTCALPIYRGRALLVSLHREAEAVPIREDLIAKRGGDDLERQFEAIRLFGIDRELQIVRSGEPRQLDELRRQFLEHPLARDRLVTWMQSRELDRNSRPAFAAACMRADRGDGA